MTTLSDLFDLDEFHQMVNGGYIRLRSHPHFPLQIANYTARTQYTGRWNPVTTLCRGLIFHTDGRIVARPFPKFFNLGEPHSTISDGPVTVTDKLDGSLGVLYPYDGRHHIATRGSFTSAQADHATTIWQHRYTTFVPNPAWTYLFEIVYPDNRIVVDYGPLDDLILLGAVDIATGRTIPLEHSADTWPGPVVTTFPYRSLDDAVNAPPRPGQEGLVIHFTDTDHRIKIKYDDYLHRHRIVTSLSTITVFDHLRTGQPLEHLLELLPDETYDQVRSVAADLTTRFHAIRTDLHHRFEQLRTHADPHRQRRHFAELVLASDLDQKHLLFTLADTGHIDPTAIWDQIRPPFVLLHQLGGLSSAPHRADTTRPSHR